ncbi:MAG: TPM domain-containing protein [Gammaproteobacteria bacterium]
MGMFRVLLLLVAAFWLPAHAVDFPPPPEEGAFLVDNATMVTADDANAINRLAATLLEEERVALYVLTIESLARYDAASLDIESYARKVFDHWGVGFKDFNYGILLLVSRGDRKARIELGAGYDGRLDGATRNIMNDLIIPHFRAREFSLGIADGVRGLDAMARGEDLPKPTQPWWVLPALGVAVILFVMMIVNLFKTGRSGWAWALIIGVGVLLFFLLRVAGSAGGLGGGSSGGGGATGSW